MKLENQVTNLELSRKLKELRVKQESLYVWGVNQNDDYALATKDASDWDYLKNCPYFSAFTVAELGEMLSKGGKKIIKNTRLTGWAEKGDTEANARAKMLIYSLENL